MSKRPHAATGGGDPLAARAASSSAASASAAAAAAAEEQQAKRVKFDELVASGFGAEAFGGKPLAKSSVDGMQLGAGGAAAAAAGGGGAEQKHATAAADYDDEDAMARLHGGSLSAEEEMEAILRLVDQAPEVAEVDAAAVRQSCARFSRAAARNLEQRDKFGAEQPEKFMESEIALDEAIHAMQGIATAAHLYPLLLERIGGGGGSSGSGGVGATTGESAMETLCTLIAHHENLDIATDCIALLHELVDAETIGQAEQQLDDEAAAAAAADGRRGRQQQLSGNRIMRPFVDFITGGAASAAEAAGAAGSTDSSSFAPTGPSLFLSTIVSALSRFPSEHAAEQSTAVTQLLSILENLTDLEPRGVSVALVAHTPLLEWLLKRLRDDNTFNANKLHASEILSIVLTNAGRAGQDALGNRNVAAKTKPVLGGLGIKTLIRLIARYRKEDPSNSEETEYLENLFDVLCVVLLHHIPNQTLFASHDGLQLMLTMIKRFTYAKNAAFKALDYALANHEANAALFVDLGGLKALFGALMFNPSSKKDKADQTRHEQHLLSILVQLLLHTSDVRYLRVLRKFTEQEMIKTERVVELLTKYSARVDDAERAWKQLHQRDGAAAAAAAAGSDELDMERYARASEHGQAHVDFASIILAFLATAGEADLRERVEQLLNQQDVPLTDLQRTLRQYVAMMGDEDEEQVEDGETSASAAAAAPPAAASSSSSSSNGKDAGAQAQLKTKRVLEALAAMLDQPVDAKP
jgi:beta-catenin-like protein 1